MRPDNNSSNNNNNGEEEGDRRGRGTNNNNNNNNKMRMKKQNRKGIMMNGSQRYKSGFFNLKFTFEILAEVSTLKRQILTNDSSYYCCSKTHLNYIERNS
jgi:hypothetical protein